MRIARKILLAVAVMAVGFVTTVGTSWVQGQRNLAFLGGIETNAVPAVRDAVVAKVAFRREFRAYQEAVLSGELEALKTAAAHAKEVEAALTSLRDSRGHYGSSEAAAEHLRVHQAWCAKAVPVYGKLAGGDMDDALMAKAGELAKEAGVDVAEGEERDPKSLTARLQSLDSSVTEALSTAIVGVGKGVRTQNLIMLGVFGGSISISVFLVAWVTLGIARRLAAMSETLEALGRGNIRVQVERKADDEVGDMADALRGLLAALQEKVKVAQIIADGDLSNDVDLASPDDELGLALQAMTNDLNSVLGDVLQAEEQVSSGAGGLESASQALSKGATDSAASVQEITSAMTQIGSQTATNAKNATAANRLASEATDSAGKGSERMNELMSAMSEISESSQQIAKIIKVIDDIAFQTNLLALNAAVEAARAGRHGKGFAVVAEEVRSLAGRSARAAKDTAELIEESGRKVSAGTAIASTTAEALNEIVSSVQKTTGLIGEIAASSNEQAQGVAQVNQGLRQIDDITQRNTASAEETASAAQDLARQASILQQLLSRFRLKRSSGQSFDFRDDDELAAPESTVAPEVRQLNAAEPAALPWGGVGTDDS